jgi:adenosylcobinamide-GDP ribazoletransferase
VSFFPLVGTILGLTLAGLDGLLGLVWPPSFVNASLLVALILLTGALHLDGFIDTCDGLGGFKTPHERWEIMRDSRVGSFGVVGAICLLLLKYACLGSLAGASRLGGLILMPVLSRWAVVCSIFSFPSARADGLGRMFKEQMSWPGLTLATLVTAVVSLGIFRMGGMALMLGVWLVAMALATFLSRRFAGLTGDTYGAIVEVTEVVALMLISLLP